MGSKPSHAINGTRQRLLEAAYETLADRGATQTTTREIARRAGLSEAGLYVHFKSKRDLLIALLHERLDIPLISLRVDESNGSPNQVLTQVLRRAIEDLPRQLAVLGALYGDEELSEAIRNDPPFEGRLPGLESLTSYITAQQQKGLIGTKEKPVVLSRLLLAGALQHAYMSWLIGPEQVEPKEAQWAKVVTRAVIRAAGPTASTNRRRPARRR